MTPDDLLRTIVNWAERDANVLCLVVTGSRAQGAGPEDDFSDIDLEVIAENIPPLAETDEWLRQFAPLWIYLPLYQDQGYATRLIWYEGGIKVDFTLADSRRLLQMIEHGQLDELYRRGYRVLIDKVGLTADLPSPTGDFPIVTLPDQREFQAVVEGFWFEAAHIPKYLVRNEPWVVKFRDWTMKCRLLKLMEWHAVALSDEPVDVRYIGTHLRDWVDDSVWNDLQHVFAHFDVKDSWNALLAMMDLVRRLGQEIASCSDLTYPQHVDDGITGYIQGFAGQFG